MSGGRVARVGVGSPERAAVHADFFSMSILDCCRDAEIFGGWFARGDWTAWFVFLAALFGEPLTEPERAVFHECTGRTVAPAQQAREAYLVVGRRGGKTLILALICVFMAVFRDWTAHLAPGERATIMLVAADRRQARIALRYIKALLHEVSLLEPLVENETADSVHLRNRVTIEVHTCSLRSTRGYALACVAADEAAFWRSEESSEPDEEVLNAIRPGLSGMPGSMLLVGSSPYGQRGALFAAHRRHYAQDGDPVLVWQASTRRMNPSISQAVVDAAYEADPQSAMAEYGGLFRTDVDAYISREAVDAAVVAGRRELPPIAGMTYRAFLDAAGGSGSDSMTIAVAHREPDGRVLLDLVREKKPPFSPASCVAEMAEALRPYGVRALRSDRYAGDWPAEAFQRHGITCTPAAKPKSDLYRELLPLLNSAKVELLDNARLISQLTALERRTARGGRDSIDHVRGGHDDVINAAAGAIALASAQPTPVPICPMWTTADPNPSGWRPYAAGALDGGWGRRPEDWSIPPYF